MPTQSAHTSTIRGIRHIQVRVQTHTKVQTILTSMWKCVTTHTHTHTNQQHWLERGSLNSSSLPFFSIIKYWLNIVFILLPYHPFNKLWFSRFLLLLYLYFWSLGPSHPNHKQCGCLPRPISSRGTVLDPFIRCPHCPLGLVCSRGAFKRCANGCRRGPT